MSHRVMRLSKYAMVRCSGYVDSRTPSDVIRTVLERTGRSPGSDWMCLDNDIIDKETERSATFQQVPEDHVICHMLTMRKERM